MADFPRTKKPRRGSALEFPAPLISVAQAGSIQSRGTGQIGVQWEETWPALLAGDPDVEALITWIQWAHSTGQIFDIDLLYHPGSGKPPNGAGGGTPLIKGAAQSGSSLATDGWSFSVTGVVKAGDLIKIAGLTPIFRVTEDANSDGAGNATIKIVPSIRVGAEPADNAAITTTGNKVRARIVEPPQVPAAGPGQYYTGLRVRFREAP